MFMAEAHSDKEWQELQEVARLIAEFTGTRLVRS